MELHRWDNEKFKFIFVELLGMDADLDLAILDPSIHAKAFNALKVELNPDYTKGTIVHTIGYPNYNSGEEPTYIETKIIGKSSFMGRERIKIDGNIKHGNSGGVVLNTDGKVVGIVSNGNAVGAGTKSNSSFIPIKTLVKYHENLEKKLSNILVTDNATDETSTLIPKETIRLETTANL